MTLIEFEDETLHRVLPLEFFVIKNWVFLQNSHFKSYHAQIVYLD